MPDLRLEAPQEGDQQHGQQQGDQGVADDRCDLQARLGEAQLIELLQVELSYLQFPLAAANAVVLLGAVLTIICTMTRLVDLRREL